MSSLFFLNRVVFSSLVIFCLAASEPGYAGSLRHDEPTQKPEAPKRVMQMKTSELDAAVTTRVEPAYPTVATWAGVSGDVMVRVLINQQGDVISGTSDVGH